MAATIVDVARRAGVSYQTVSNVINGRFSEMGEETRHRVEEAIGDLDFHPNERARSLRRRHGRVIGFLTVDASTNFIAAPFTSQILAGVAHAADEASDSLLLQATRPRAEDEPMPAGTFSRLFLEGRLDGAVVALSGPRWAWERYLRELADGLFPFVLVQERFSGPSNACVLTGDREGGMLAADHLMALGHRTIGFINENAVWPALEERLAGYQEALAGYGLVHGLTLVEESPESPEAVTAAVERLLARHPEMTAFIGFNDLVAMGALAAVQRAGRMVPEDFSVVGFDDFAFAAYLSPSLTTVQFRGRDVGQSAAELLIGYLETGEFAEAEVLFPATLVTRGSTARARPISLVIS